MLALQTFITDVFSNFSYLLVVVLLSLVIFANGFSDAPNAIATCVSTRAVTPKKALIMSFIFNFLGILVMSFINASVAITIFNIVDFGNESGAILALSAALISIVLWAFFSGNLGIPTSESHALIAGLTGAVIAFRGNFVGVNGNEWLKVMLGIVVSIVLGFIVGYIFTKIIESIFKNYDRRKTMPFFEVSQIFGGAFMSFMHGAQAGQKFIGVFLMGILVFNGASVGFFSIPIWLMVYCSLLMSLGTAVGGYKIIRTVGMKMSNLELYQGAVADISTSFCLLIASLFGIPISTSHTKSLSIMGVGASRRLSSINFNVVKNILYAGIITFPCCGLLAFIITKIMMIFI